MRDTNKSCLAHRWVLRTQGELPSRSRCPLRTTDGVLSQICQDHIYLDFKGAPQACCPARGQLLDLSSPRTCFGAWPCSLSCPECGAHSMSTSRSPGACQKGPGVPAGACCLPGREGEAPPSRRNTSVSAACPPVLPCRTGCPGDGPEVTSLKVFREHTLTCKTGRHDWEPCLRLSHQKTR